MIFIPDSLLKNQYGIDLRFNFCLDSDQAFSLKIAQNANDPKYSFSVFADQNINPIYNCNFLQPPPWQLVSKTSLLTVNSFTDHASLSCMDIDQNQQDLCLEEEVYPFVDKLLEELHKDPLEIVQYIQNEITFEERNIVHQNNVFYASNIYKTPTLTYLERQGSAWEICQLLVYLLRKAGYKAAYAYGECHLPKDYVEKLFSITIEGEQDGVVLKYPWVVFFDGNQWVSVFPWMKETQITEGQNLYDNLPEKYSTSNRWILQYLKGDEDILKHTAIDGDDTAGVLFVRFVKEELRKKGLSIEDIGVHQCQLKKQISSWEDLLHPIISSPPQIFYSLKDVQKIFVEVMIEVYSKKNTQKKISYSTRLCNLCSTTSSIAFSSDKKNHEFLHLQFANEEMQPLELDESDQLIEIKISVQNFDGKYQQVFSINKNTTAALCFYIPGKAFNLSSVLHEDFSSQKDEKKRFISLLSLIGTAYFEKCCRSERILAELHKVKPLNLIHCGLAKLCYEKNQGILEQDLIFPQVDMASLKANPYLLDHSYMEFISLVEVDSSSNEHQIIKEIFKDYYALSTIKVLQLSHFEQIKKGNGGEGFLNFNRFNFELADKDPKKAQDLYFSNIKDLDLSSLKCRHPKEWDLIKEILNPNNNLSNWSYAYITPEKMENNKEFGALIISPYRVYSLISSNSICLQGGKGSALPYGNFYHNSINKYELVPNGYINGYTLQVQPSQNQRIPPQFTCSIGSVPENIKRNLDFWNSYDWDSDAWDSDVRMDYKPFFNGVADPVDVVTGAFYVDETDLMLQGSFPLEIRRNYNSQNPIVSNIGLGWKLSLNPNLVEKNGNLLAAEPDGTVITYRYNEKTNCFEVFPEDNPDLYYFPDQSEYNFNPFHSYIKNNVLYSPDGSKRFFENGLLQKWVNTKGDSFTFIYKNGNLSRIESSNGDFLGFHYNHDNLISEIYATDGKRITYEYSALNDLVRVTLPNTAVIIYDYDRFHRIIRITKPKGDVIENIYDEQGRIIQQRSPMGIKQQIIPTAYFEYSPDQTIVIDGCNGKTIYKIFQKQIYKIVDPLGNVTLQSWFIDEKSYFDPLLEKVVEWNQPGAFKKSLKSSIDKRSLTTSYLYDLQGNVAEIGLTGEDLTGDNEKFISKKFVYNNLNLCVLEEVCNQKTCTIYDGKFLYFPKRIEKRIDDALVSYIEFEYDSSGQLIKENNCGSINLWKYNDRGLPVEQIQKTNTQDPDVITMYAYNYHGKIVEVKTSDGIEKRSYDIMGNLIESKIFSLSNSFISSSYIAYDLNCRPIMKQTANSNNQIYFDYHAGGFIKAVRKISFPTQSIIYNYYEYDPRGFLIEETDARGSTTYKEYDAIGNILSQTKEGLTTSFTYEAGGLVKTITSPSKAVTTRNYTTNGLLKEEIFPDGTKNSYVYDFFGRLVLETKNDLTWSYKYDDINHKVIKTHLKTQNTEISEFDLRGNLVRFTDSEGNISENTYDSLNRIKTKTTAEGWQTVYSYQNDLVLCTFPNKEIVKNRYSASRIVESQVFDEKGTLLSSSQYCYDAINDSEVAINGDEKTVTSLNILGLPVKVQKGDISSSYEYDACGNCIALTDGEDKTTYQKFDGLNRLIQKKMPDGSIVDYKYDSDSNLIEYHLPNGAFWHASYDSMRRKISEELISDNKSTNSWEFIYENGYLKTSIDPMKRIHSYVYDSYGQLVEENVDVWHKRYTYDKRGLVITAQQMRDNDISWFSSWIYGTNDNNSLIERSYDKDGNLLTESVFLNSSLISKTAQKWSSNKRSLQINDHCQDFIYKNNQLSEVSAKNVSLSFTYDLSNRLKTKKNNFCSTTYNYNSCSLFDSIITDLPEGRYEEKLQWNASGMLSDYLSPQKKQKFTYNDSGYLKTDGLENYDYNKDAKSFVHTSLTNDLICQNDLDDFGKILSSSDNVQTITPEYDSMGQITSYDSKKFEWDAWGRLTKVTDHGSTWEASYDAFGRRLQTVFKQNYKDPVVTTSYYDPEKEFTEIGSKINDKTFWKVYGPDCCQAVIDDSGNSVFLITNGLDQLIGIGSDNKTVYLEEFPTSFGYLEVSYNLPQDVVSYAKILNWHSKSQDPTGLIWMGKRYYDPKTARFLSSDPVSYPFCLDLYIYANGDPINYIDPDGRFSSYVYQGVKSKIISAGSYIGTKFEHHPSNFGLSIIGNTDSSNLVYYLNGQMNKPNEAWEGANVLYNNLKGIGNIAVKPLYCGSRGLWDSVKTLPECGGLRYPKRIKMIQNELGNHADYLIKNNIQTKSFIVAFSRGANDLHLSLQGLSQEQKNQFIIITAGFATAIPKNFGFKVVNIRTTEDRVPWMDYLACLGFEELNDDIIPTDKYIINVIPNEKKGFADHYFQNPSYQLNIHRAFNAFYEKYGVTE